MREAAVIGIAASDRHVETGHLCRSLRRRRSCGVRLCYDQLLNVSRKFCFELYRTASPNWEQTKNDFNKESGRDLNQDIGDTVGQATGKKPIPPRSMPNTELDK